MKPKATNCIFFVPDIHAIKTNRRAVSTLDKNIGDGFSWLVPVGKYIILENEEGGKCLVVDTVGTDFCSTLLETLESEIKKPGAIREVNSQEADYSMPFEISNGQLTLMRGTTGGGSTDSVTVDLKEFLVSLRSVCEDVEFFVGYINADR